jgi:sterol desaturase/sphingolipid hydroxylase (fatty acid hydroxylase superfamily)
MLQFHLQGSFLGIALTLAIGVLAAELFGYWLHRLLHSGLIPALSRSHLIHHLLLYGPGRPMRSSLYHDATDDRFALGNIGVEWLAPSAIILFISWALMRLFHVPPVYQTIALATLLGWPILMFSYLHDGMHLENFWMARVPVLRNWFLKSRRLHDIHHHNLRDDGTMHRNFGIGFYFFDRVFRTLANRHCPLNRTGYRAALEREGFDESELVSLRECSKRLFGKSASPGRE